MTDDRLGDSRLAQRAVRAVRWGVCSAVRGIRRLPRAWWYLLGMAAPVVLLIELQMGLVPVSSPETWQQDCDRALMYRELTRYGPGKWMTGVWVGHVPFWRPLSSLLIWAEYKLIGWERQEWFELVNIVAFAILCGVFMAFMEDVTGRTWIGAVALWILCVGTPAVFGWQPTLTRIPRGAIKAWKHQVDVFMALCLFGSLVGALRGRAWSAALAAAAAGFKETGFMAFPLLTLFAWWKHRRLEWWVWLAWAIGLVEAGVKMAGVGAGWVMGRNVFWAYRIFLRTCPYPVSLILSPLGPFAAAGVGGALAVLDRRRWVLWTAVGGVSGAAIGTHWYHEMTGTWDVVAGAAWLADIKLWTIGMTAFCWVIAAAAGFSVEVVLLAVGYLAMIVPCAAVPQVVPHDDMIPHAYLASMFFSAAVVAAAWGNVGKRTLGKWVEAMEQRCSGEG